MRVDPKTGEASTARQAILESFKDGSGPIRNAGPSLKASTDFYKMDLNLASKTN
jgi:hypothetical protein